MATTRSCSLSLSLALHGALLAGVVWVGSARPPKQQAPSAVTVVWVESGAPALAGASRGDAGIVDAAESDPAGEPLNEPIAATDDPDRPAPPQPDARDPVSGADRPAPPQTEPADENRERRSEADVAESDLALAAAGGARDPAEAVPPPDPSDADDVREVAERPVATHPSAEPPIETNRGPAERPASVASAALPTAAPADVPTLPERTAEPFPETPSADPAAADTASSPVLADQTPLSKAEQQKLRTDVMDLLNRSRELPSRPSVAWSRNGREYRAEMIRVRSAGTTGIEEALIEVVAEHDGRHISTEMHVKRLSFSHYAQFIDRWDPSVQIHDDVIDGRFHSNTGIVIENSGGVQPVFHGMVTTTSGIDTSKSTRRVRRNQVFLGGLETRVPRIALPRRFAPLETIAADALDVVVLETDSRIVFHADGTYDISTIGGGRKRSGALGPSPAYFIAAGKSAVSVEGTVNGQVLVYSPKEIVVEGDLVYAADPRKTADSDDYLGLVSDGSVEIAGPEVTGPGDLTVHAAIYAKHRFAVRRYSRGERATLTVYGSVTAGSLTATEPRFRTKLEFDPRLENARPPSFPLTDRYELASWDGVWRAER